LVENKGSGNIANAKKKKRAFAIREIAEEVAAEEPVLQEGEAPKPKKESGSEGHKSEHKGQKAEKHAGAKGGKKTEKKGIAGFFVKNPAVAAGILCIAIVAVLAAVAVMPKVVSIDDFWGKMPDNAVLKMIIISSNRCPGCEEGNSFENLFKANGIAYETNVFEESSSDGQGLIGAIGIEKLPAFLIEEKSVSDGMVVGTNSGNAPLEDVLKYYVSQGDGTYKDGVFSFPELDLEGVEEAKRAKLLLGEACGDGTNFVIQYFADPYDPNTIENSRNFENFRDLIESSQDINVSFKYNYLPTYSRLMEAKYLELFGGNPATVRENIQGAAKYLTCANDAFGTKYFNRLERALYSTYCGFEFDLAETQDINGLIACADSNHYNVFINGEELLRTRQYTTAWP
jgi:hypothetical protein